MFGDFEMLCSYLFISSRNITECLLFARHWASHTVENKMELVSTINFTSEVHVSFMHNLLLVRMSYSKWSRLDKLFFRYH